MKKWWALRHIADTQWHAIKVFTLFGIPLCTQFYEAVGSFKSEGEAKSWAYLANNQEGSSDDGRL